MRGCFSWGSLRLPQAIQDLPLSGTAGEVMLKRDLCNQCYAHIKKKAKGLTLYQLGVQPQVGWRTSDNGLKSPFESLKNEWDGLSALNPSRLVLPGAVPHKR